MSNMRTEILRVMEGKVFGLAKCEGMRFTQDRSSSTKDEDVDLNTLQGIQ